MNKIILSVALSAITVSAPVLAQTGQYSTTPVVAKQVVANPVDTPVSTTLQATANQPVDISFAFKDGQNLQVKDMTQTEMEETQGAWGTYVALGGIGAYFGYLNYTSNVPKEQRTTAGYATAVGSGAVGLALGASPLGVVRGAFVGGTVATIGSSASTNLSKK